MVKFVKIGSLLGIPEYCIEMDRSYTLKEFIGDVICLRNREIGDFSVQEFNAPDCSQNIYIGTFSNPISEISSCPEELSRRIIHLAFANIHEDLVSYLIKLKEETIYA